MKLFAATVFLAAALAPLPAFATPLLKTTVSVSAGVVTVGDMFSDAGNLASQPLFLAPAPGTSGSVDIDDVRVAAVKAGLALFDDAGARQVEVSRLGVPVDAPLLTGLLSDALKARGILTDGMTASATFDAVPAGLIAAAMSVPVSLANFNYNADNGLFTVRATLAGIDQPIDLSGHIDLMVEAPSLTATLASGTILKDSDIVMQPVSVRLVQNGNVATMDQLVGKALQRQSRAGMVLKVSDVSDPQVIARNDIVTVYLHAGPMTLTIKGTALNNASLGQPVSVLNAVSKKMVHGTARADGAVEVTTGPTNVAGL